MRSLCPPQHRHQQGVSLIEVLVAILVIALGILTMLAMQINSTKLTKTSEVRAMGALLVSDLADRMRANRTGFEAGEYTFTETTSAPTITKTCTASNSNCTPAEMAAQDKFDWLTNIRDSLPTGTARISAVDTASGKNGVDVWLIWLDPKEASDAGTPSPSTCPPQDELADSVKTASLSGALRCMYFRINV
ncbi:MAG: type IV pilus modification protein PilV [Aquabacterium sp.]|uniref:type IV pilus modification protein PilV n=1 Tax=Aquabacterium sp. TaxID=1872578 RepID=UPI0025C4F198|nr:type IV pilus modification protein PilV [Aquabacterium sp.]MBI5925442.1 type IV pilus modification protein PilV [Aquabacterium sp.]